MILSEHFHKNFSHADGKERAAVLLGFGFVFAQSQAASGMLLRSGLAKTSKLLAAPSDGTATMAYRGKPLTLLTSLVINNLSPYKTPYIFFKVLTSLILND